MRPTPRRSPDRLYLQKIPELFHKGCLSATICRTSARPAGGPACGTQTDSCDSSNGLHHRKMRSYSIFLRFLICRHHRSARAWSNDLWQLLSSSVPASRIVAVGSKVKETGNRHRSVDRSAKPEARSQKPEHHLRPPKKDPTMIARSSAAASSRS